MLKKVFLAAAAALILASATVAMTPAPAMAHSGCHKAAKALYPHDRKARRAYEKVCKAHYKAHKHHHHHHHLFGK
jgi:multidrug efflux pump subunit AcrB